MRFRDTGRWNPHRGVPRNGVDIALAKHDVVGAVDLDLVPVLRVEEDLVAGLDRADIGADGDNLGPGQALADLSGRRNEDATATAALPFGVAQLHQDPVVQHLDRKAVVIVQGVLGGHPGNATGTVSAWNLSRSRPSGSR